VTRFIFSVFRGVILGHNIRHKMIDGQDWIAFSVPSILRAIKRRRYYRGEGFR
jgi:hypothetical protein